MTASRWPAVAALAAMLLAVAPAGAVAGSEVSWTRVAHLEGIFDVAGTMPDDRLVVAGSEGLFLLDPDGGVPVRLAPGYHGQNGEAYAAVSPGLAVDGAGCSFAPGDVFVLRLSSPAGVLRVDAAGDVRDFATPPGLGSPNGIVFDTVGRFGHRLLVSGGHGKSTSVVALDCRGRSTMVTGAGPALEGGLAVAPSGFGTFAGDLVAPDEYSGHIVAIGADGRAATVVDSGLPTGQDIGVESAGFVPPGFAAGGGAFVADRATGNSAHPGSDSLLRIASSSLTAAGVRDGDLLVATEGGARLIGVRCASTCVVRRLSPETAAHGEGHLLAVATRPAATAPPLPADPRLGAGARGQEGLPPLALGGIVAGAVALLAVLVLLGVMAARRRGS